MNFWIFSVALLAISAAVIAWPMFAGNPRERLMGISILVLLPLAGLLLYQQIGTPEAISMPAASTEKPPQHTADTLQMNQMIVNLRQRLADNPNDLEGWIMLGRSLTALERHKEAVVALNEAMQLSSGDATIMVELAEARLYVSGGSDTNSEHSQLLEAALEIDPQQRRALWLLGLVKVQSGNYEQSIHYWERLMPLLEPTSESASTVAQQIEIANSMLGKAQHESTSSPEMATGLEIPVTLTLNAKTEQALPPEAVMFVFVHPADSRGMPLAVKRIAPPEFPLSLTLTDADILRPGTSLSDFSQLDISARISMTGVANATLGDLQAQSVRVEIHAVTEVSLHLDQRVP